MSTKQTKPKFYEWHLIRFGGMLTVRMLWLWAKIFRTTNYRLDLSRPLDHKSPTVYASNHQTMLDSPAVFTALSVLQLHKAAPVKFMTWHKYYNTKYKPLLWLTGCYSSHGDGLTGLDAATEYALQGYGSFMYPEGKRTRPGTRNPAYPGISRLMERLPSARLVLVHIEWEPRSKRFSKPKLSVSMRDAPSTLDVYDPEAIMDAIYDT